MCIQCQIIAFNGLRLLRYATLRLHIIYLHSRFDRAEESALQNTEGQALNEH